MGVGGGFYCSVPQYGWGEGESGGTHTGTHTGTYTRMLHLPFSDLPLKKCPKDSLSKESVGKALNDMTTISGENP